MTWLIALVVLIIVIAIGVAFLNRFYRKGSRAVALVRTGLGGKRIVVDGGCLVLPFLHQVSEMNMRTVQIEVARTGARSVITEDRLRVDAVVEFFVHVIPTEAGIATASQTLGGKSFRAAELTEMIGGKMIDGIQAVIARHSMDSLHEDRAGFIRELRELVSPELEKNGLELETAALTRLDQTPFGALDENNAFNAVGMRRLAEVIAQNKKQRAAIEADAEVSVRQSQLDATKRRLIIEQEEEQAGIEQQLHIQTVKARQVAEIAEREAESELRSEEARINREREVRVSEIDKNTEVRKRELTSRLETELADRDNVISLTKKTAEEARAQAEADEVRGLAAQAAEAVQTEKDKAVAERARQVAQIRAREKAEVEAERLRADTDTIRQEAAARAEAAAKGAEAHKTEMLAEAAGRAAMAEAENALSEDVIRMRVDLRRLDRLPQVVEQMVKPAEKIEGIRIHHLSGFGGGGSAGGGGNSGGGAGAERPMVNQAIDGLMGMTLQLPALQKLGREIGIDIGNGLDGLADSATGPDKPAKPEEPDA